MDIGDTDLMNSQPARLMVNRTALRLPMGQFFSERHQKSLIVLHFTAGSSAASAFNSWAGDQRRVAAPYIVDRDGTVFEVFDPACWAYALGLNHPQATPTERRAIQIEIANVGPLKRRGDDLYWWPKDWGVKYCGLAETAKYHQADYRGMQYWATYTPQQEAAVCWLVALLCEKYKIPPVVAKDKLHEANVPFFIQFKGIASHQNFRSDKFDVGPAFFWDELRTSLA